MATIGQINTVLTANTGPLAKGLGKARGMFSSFGSSLGGVVSKFGPLVAGLGGMATAVKSVGAAQEQLLSERKLASVIASTGGAAGLSAKEIQDYAAELQTLTNYGDEVTISAAAVLGTFTKVKGDVFKDALAAAQDMSAILGTDLQGSALQLGKALNDPVKGMTALSRAGVSFTQEQKEQVKLLQQSGDLVGAQRIILGEMETQFGGAAAATANPLTQMKNALGDVAETVGFVLLPTLDAVSKTFTGIFSGISGNRAVAEQFGQTLLGVWEMAKQGFLDIKQFAFDAATVVGFAWENMGDIASLMWERTKLGAVSFWEDIKFLFTTQIPGVLTWFVDNWQDIFFTGVDYALTMMINLGKNIRALWSGVLDFISGKGFNVDFTPLEEGFVNTVKAMPDIGERELTALEQQLQGRVDSLSSSLSDGLGETLLASRATSAPPSMVGSTPDAAVETTGTDIAEAVTTKMDELGGVKAVQRGSADAFSQIFSAMRGGAQDKQLKAAEGTQKDMARAVTELRKLNSNPPVELVAGGV